MKKKDEQTIEKQSAESAEAVETVETAEQNAEKSDVQAQLKAANEATASAVAAAEDFKRKWYSVTAEYDNYRNGGNPHAGVCRGQGGRREQVVPHCGQSGTGDRRL